MYVRLGLPSGLLPSGFPTKTLCAPLLFLIRSTCPHHLSFLDLVTQMMFGDEYKHEALRYIVFATPPSPTSPHSPLIMMMIMTTKYVNVLCDILGYHSGARDDSRLLEYEPSLLHWQLAAFEGSQSFSFICLDCLVLKTKWRATFQNDRNFSLNVTSLQHRTLNLEYSDWFCVEHGFD